MNILNSSPVTSCKLWDNIQSTTQKYEEPKGLTKSPSKKKRADKIRTQNTSSDYWWENGTKSPGIFTKDARHTMRKYCLNKTDRINSCEQDHTCFIKSVICLSICSCGFNSSALSGNTWKFTAFNIQLCQGKKGTYQWQHWEMSHLIPDKA